MGGDIIQIHYGAVESVQAAINQFCGQMESELNTVDRKFKHLLAEGWEGMSAGAFQHQSDKWHNGADRMKQTLQLLAQKVGNASTHFQQTDSKAAQAFQ